MNARAMLQRHRALRWLAPIGVLGVVGVVANGMFSAGATPRPLPSTDPARLIAGVQTSHQSGWYGTVVSSMSLGLPQLPQLSPNADEATLTSMLTGSHTLQVWYGGIDKQRVALFGPTAETDLFRDGDNVWEWSSAGRSAVHVVLPAALGGTLPVADAVSGSAAATGPAAAASSLTPEVLARRALAALDPSTKVSINRHAGQVADRATYQLVLTPRTTQTLIGSVHISVDGATKLPLGVQVYPRGSKEAAIDVAFTSIHFSQPSDRNFTFTPPKDAVVRTVRLDRVRVHRMPAADVKAADTARSATGPLTGLPHGTRVLGSGWTRVVATSLSGPAVQALRHGVLSRAAVPASGSWGHGLLYETSLVDALVTSDGRAYAGAVEPAVLYAAAGSK